MTPQLRITLSDLARREGVHVSTVWRWSRRGFAGHRLETFRVGHRVYTTPDAYRAWLAAINAPPATRD